MKSIRAKEHIEEWIFDAADLVDADGVGDAVIRRGDAIRAVNIAEEEMYEKAINAFCAASCPKGCSFGQNGTCAAQYRFIREMKGYGND